MTLSTRRVNIGGTGLPIEFAEDSLDKTLGDQLYLNVSGDKMDGELKMGSQKIRDVGMPEKLTDAANKLYVDEELKKIKNIVSTSIVKEVMNLQKKVGYNSKHITEKYKEALTHITSLKHFLQKKIPKYERVNGIIANASNVNNLVL